MEHDFGRPMFTETYDPYTSHLPTPAMMPAVYGRLMPYEVDVKTERQMFVNDVQLRHDSSISTFSALGPPQLHATLPTFTHHEDLLHDDLFGQSSSYCQIDPALFGQADGQSFSYLATTIPVEESDRPLLDHFVENVLRLIFPILDVHQRGTARARAILNSLETNKSYLHCCLSVSAIHLKATAGLTPEQIDHDIMRHRYEAVAQLCQTLHEDTKHEKILDATLAMIFFHCSVGAPDDYLPDIPWSEHFQAASNLVTKLDLPTTMVQCANPYSAPPFSMSLTSWIDILGATMLGRTPQFAHTYRAKHLNGTSSGLRELMGCDDRVMYLISEIACLDALKAEGRVDDMAVCSHVSALGQQLEYTEPADPTLESPYNTTSGATRPDQLTKNMTAVFRLAARIYLCSLVPGSDRSQPSTMNLVHAVTNVMQYIPSGPHGFDRSLVWPLLITGAFSTPGSAFRTILHDRAVTLGELADFGSFGRMFRVLQEVWRLTDDAVTPLPTTKGESEGEATLSSSPSSTSPSSSAARNVKSPSPGTPGMREIKKQHVHWRDIMNRNGWRYLLI